MKRCKVKGIANSDSEEERFTDLLLCDFCIQADAKRLSDAQVVSCENYDSIENMKCEVCGKSISEEFIENGFRVNLEMY